MKMNEKRLLRLENVGKKYLNGPEELHILRGIDIDFISGESVVITGESGSGKSTLLNLIGGLDSPTYGSITMDGFAVHSATEEELTRYRNKEVGFIFQFHYLLKDFTARENIMMPAFMGGLDKQTALAKADELLDQVDLGQRRDFFPAQLSGGERQRVAVARALINQPNLVLADEPTGNLDERHSGMVAELLFELTSHYKTSLLVVTHDLSLSRMSDRHLHLTDGVLESDV